MGTTKKTTTIASTQTPTPKSLFDSIVDNEALQVKEYECQKLANRVGLIKKILINRDLFALNLEFDQRMHELIKEFANRIDDELHSTDKD